MTRYDLNEYLEWVRARKRELETAGVRLPTDEEMRNKGTRRTPEKREFLRRCDERARAAGIPPVKHYY